MASLIAGESDGIFKSRSVAKLMYDLTRAQNVNGLNHSNFYAKYPILYWMSPITEGKKQLHHKKRILKRAASVDRL